MHACLAEATNTNFIVFGLIRPGLEPTIYHTRGEHANHYAIDAVSSPFGEKFTSSYQCRTLTALRSKSKNWLARNQDNVSEWSDMSIH